MITLYDNHVNKNKEAPHMRKALILPTKYVQGEDELLNLGYFVTTFGKSALLIANPDDVDRIRPQLEATA
jgi:glycerol dehydrogenase